MAASRSRLLEREPKLFVFETLYYAFCGQYCFFDSSARTVFTERWRHLTYRNEPNFINNVLLVAKEYFHFKLSNVTKCANFYGIVLFPRVIVFLAMYTFVIVTMRLCGQPNTSPK